MHEAFLPSPVQWLEHPILTERKVQVWIKRDDLIHRQIMGNKWRKLKYVFHYIKEKKLSGIETYGGAYSNHLAAVAAAGYMYKFSTRGYVRGDELNAESNPTVNFAATCGMELKFITRAEYRKVTHQQSIEIVVRDNWLILPEGGTTRLSLAGCAEIVEELNQAFDYYCVPVGTGGTLAGILMALRGRGKVVAFAALKGEEYISSIRNKLIDLGAPLNNLILVPEVNFGGYGRYKPELLQFILGFRQDFQIVLEPIYTAKMVFNVWEMIKNGEIAEGSKVLLIHTGGLQGIAGFNHQHHLQLPIE